MGVGGYCFTGAVFSLFTSISRGCAELGGEGRNVCAVGFGWNEGGGGLDDSAARRSPEDTRLKCRTVDGEFPKSRFIPRGSFGKLLTRRAVGVEPEDTRLAVAVDDDREDGRQRSGIGESGPFPRGPALRSMCCIIEAHAFASVEGIRAVLRRFAV